MTLTLRTRKVQGHWSKVQDLGDLYAGAPIEFNDCGTRQRGIVRYHTGSMIYVHAGIGRLIPLKRILRVWITE